MTVAVQFEAYPPMVDRYAPSGFVENSLALRWPSIHGALESAKVQHGYKVVSRGLQRLESAVFIDGAAGRLVRERPELRFVTIHAGRSPACRC